MTQQRSERARGGLADEVCRKLADEIVLGHFAPGSRLDEAMLARRFNVSRTPVREALKQLAIIGLAAYRPNRGSVVAAMTPEQLDHMFEAIGELEAACARHAALRMGESERLRLCELHAQGRTAMQAGDTERYAALDRDLHSAIIEAACNPVMMNMCTSLRHRTSPFCRAQFLNVERMGASFEEHSILIEALLAHDGATAYRQMRAHLLSARSAAARSAPVWSTASP